MINSRTTRTAISPWGFGSLQRSLPHRPSTVSGPCRTANTSSRRKRTTKASNFSTQPCRAKTQETTEQGPPRRERPPGVARGRGRAPRAPMRRLRRSAVGRFHGLGQLGRELLHAAPECGERDGAAHLERAQRPVGTMLRGGELVEDVQHALFCRVRHALVDIPVRRDLRMFSRKVGSTRRKRTPSSLLIRVPTYVLPLSLGPTRTNTLREAAIHHDAHPA